MNSRSLDPSIFIPNFAALCFVAVGLLNNMPALKSGRPANTANSGTPTAKESYATARLWEDPFEVTLPEGRIAQSCLTTPIEEFTKEWKATSPKPTTEPRILVLPVLLRGQNYPEDREFRLRTRYAVLAALARAQYVTRNHDRLGFVKNFFTGQDVPYDFFEARTVITDNVIWPPSDLRVQQTVKGPTSLIFDAPYEAVIVLWLNETHLETKLDGKGNLLNTIEKIVEKMLPQRSAESDALPHFALKVIGPTSSQGLVNLVATCSKPPAATAAPTSGTSTEAIINETPSTEKQWSPGPVLYSSRATVAQEALRLSIGPDWKKPGDWHHIGGWDWARTIATDDKLVISLLEELRRRQAHPDQNQRRNHLVLIAEWDGVYSRALARTFAAKISPANTTGKHDAWVSTYDNVHEFSYLRGLDGQTLKSSVSGGDSSRKAEAPGERAYGESQFDYLHRLQADLTALDNELRAKGERISAIGVLGSDVYDKLLVMRAFRQRFSGAVYFTTDMDAAFLDPEEREWTRNLVVGSAFGLTVSRELQGRIPPFRDSYQTGLFLTTLQALGLKEIETKHAAPSTEVSISRFNLSPHTVLPRLFEIGLEQIHPLSDGSGPSPLRAGRAPSDTGDWGPVRAGILASVFLFCLLIWQFSPAGHLRFPIPKIDPNDDRRRMLRLLPREAWQFLFCFVWLLGTIGLIAWIRMVSLTVSPPPLNFIVGCMMLAAIVGVLLVYFWSFEKIMRSLGDSAFAPALPVSAIRCAALAASVFVALGLSNLGVTVAEVLRGDGEEPLIWFDGVSIWPTDILRLVVIFLAVFFLLKAQNIWQRKHRDAADAFNIDLHDCLPISPDNTVANKIGRLLRFLSGSRKSPPRQDKKRKPILGQESERNTWWAYLIASNPNTRFWRVLAMSLLYVGFWVTLCTIYGMPFVPARGPNSFALDTGILGTGVLMHVMLLFYIFDVTVTAGLLVKRLESLIAEKKITDIYGTLTRIDALCDPISRLVYFPFTILFLLIVSRNSLFDSWTWPIVLLGIFGSGLLLLVIVAAFLQYYTRKAHASALDAINEALRDCRCSAVAATDPKSNINSDCVKARLELLKEEKDQISAFDSVVFQSWIHNPLYRAMLIPVGGVGTLQVLEKLLLTL